MNFLEKHLTFFYYLGLSFVISLPFFNFLSSPINIFEASYTQLGLIFLIFFMGGVVFCEICRWGFKIDKIKVLILFSFLYFSLFYYQNYVDVFGFIVEKTEGILPLKRIYLFGVYLILGLLALAWLSKLKAFRSSFLVFVSVVFLFSFGEFLTLMVTSNGSPAPNKKSDSLSFLFKTKPNIYFLLIDAYPRHDTLLPIRDNTPFLNFFKNHGFIVADRAYSNYPVTWSSLSATFQMSYLNKGDAIRNDILSPRKKAFIILKENNYRIVTVPSHFSVFRGKNVADSVIYANDFVGNLLSDTSKAFLSRSCLTDYLDGLFVKYLYFSLKEIEKIFSLKEIKSLFVFIHFIHFHDYVFDNKCNVVSDQRKGQTTSKDIELSSSCFEGFLEKAVNLIISKDPNAIIIVQSDHGPWHWLAGHDSQTDFDRGFGIFSAFRIPNLPVPEDIKEYLENSPSPINNFRVLFSLLAGKEPKLLSYRAFADEGDSHEVTQFRYKNDNGPSDK